MERRHRQLVSSGSPYEEPIGFSRAVRVGDRVIVAGTAPNWPDGEVDPDVERQTERCIEIMLAALAEAGGTAADVVRTDWSPGDDPLAAGVSGEVVWSPSEQRGFMRFRALQPNNPTVAQYQLWIFDGTRPSETPVDGGVFDVVDGEVIVPIDAKIDVRDATLFAITLEEPGGVVVSKRERLLLLGTVE